MQPTLTNLKRGVPTFKEELFGVAFYKVENEQEL
jgi:succinate-semialdehyde dehydrogenase/glutarate-semialdehyde dehydrogenase